MQTKINWNWPMYFFVKAKNDAIF